MRVVGGTGLDAFDTLKLGADAVDGVVIVRVECGKFCQRMWVRRVKGRIQRKGRGEKTE